MKNKKLIFLIIIIDFLLSISCMQKILTIPEVSTTVENKPVYSVENDDEIIEISSDANSIILFFKDGKIISYNAKDFTISARFQVASGLKKPIKIYGNIVIFKDKKTYRIFDTKTMSVVYSAKNKIFENIIFADKEIVIYEKEDDVVIFNYIEKKVLTVFKIKRNLIRDCIASDRKILLCCSDRIFTFDRRLKKKKNHHLQFKSNSGFLTDNDSIYYCSKDMGLIRYDLNKDKTVWKLKLPSKIVYKPIRAGKYIGLLLRDYNIYFYNKNGSLYWWEKLGTTPYLQPIEMLENIAVSLRPKKAPTIKFFNIREKKTLNYKLSNPFNSYFYCSNGIYIVSNDENGKLTMISKLENKYSVDIKILTKSALQKNKTVEFMLNAVNLIKPSFKISIFDSNNNNVFQYEIAQEEPLTFIWLPKDDGDFELVVDAYSENNEVITQKLKLKVLNINKMLNDYYYKLFLENEID